jgi:hypothetical protein
MRADASQCVHARNVEQHNVNGRGGGAGMRARGGWPMTIDSGECAIVDSRARASSARLYRASNKFSRIYRMPRSADTLLRQPENGRL